jgi:hypothetical protein
MSNDPATKPAEQAAPKPATPTEAPQVEPFHPHKRHDHETIKPASTGVTHVDPGVVTFYP